VPTYDPYDAEVMRDPYPAYRRLRDEDPVYRIDAYQAWAVTRMDDVWMCFAQPEVYSNSGGITGAQLLQRRMGPYPALGNLDPPVHTARRRAVKSWFGARPAQASRAWVQSQCRARLAALRERDTFDAVVDYGLHLSVSVVCELLAIPTSDRPMLTDWVRLIFYRPAAEAGLTDAGADAYAQLLDYFAEHARWRKRDGARSTRADPDLLDGYLAMNVGDDLASHLREVVIGGSETNPKVLAATIHRLAQHEAQRAQVAADPALATKAFNEGLRLDTPGQFMGRMVRRDIELQGRHLARGDVALLMIASANRDEREFDDPDAFDVHRPVRRAVGYGSGPHFCVGRHLAGVEGEVAVQELLAADPHYGVDLVNATRAHHEMVHGFTSLPVRWS
jgi:cytochrome P450